MASTCDGCGRPTRARHPILQTPVCRACLKKYPDRYGFITKSRAQAEFGVQLEQLAELRVFEKPNPHWKTGPRPMQLYLRRDILELAGQGLSAAPSDLPPSTQLSYWIVKGRPAENDFSALLRPGRADIWRTGRPPKEWRPGDRLFFWQGSPRLSVVGLGEFTGLRHEVTAHGEQLFGVRYLTGPLQRPVGITTLRKDPVLGGASFLKAGPAGTVFPLSAAHGSRLFALVAAQDVSAKKVWPDLGVDLIGVPSGATFIDASDLEGVITEARVTRRGRSRRLRELALEQSGGVCAVCDTDFSKVLNGLGWRVLQAHHRSQLSSVEAPRIHTVADLAIVCANCHLLLHADPKRALSVEALRRSLRRP